MSFDPKRHHRSSLRLEWYDYSEAGAYFVTLCTRNHACLFGHVKDGAVRLNEWGRVVHEEWHGIPHHYPRVSLDAFVIMPNHVHGIIVIEPLVDAGLPRPGGAGTAPLRRSDHLHRRVGAGLPRPHMENEPSGASLGQMIAYFKYRSTKAINAIRRTPGIRLWQRNYYEHIVRDEESYEWIREYIIQNPEQWAFDRENPDAVIAKGNRGYRARHNR